MILNLLDLYYKSISKTDNYYDTLIKFRFNLSLRLELMIILLNNRYKQ